MPPLLVGPLKAYFQSRGIDPNDISANGDIDPTAILSLFFDTVEVRTAVTEPVSISLKTPPDPETQALLREVQPAIVFTGPAGRAQIAPYGVPSGLNARIAKAPLTIGLGIGAGILGMMLIGRYLL